MAAGSEVLLSLPTPSRARGRGRQSFGSDGAGKRRPRPPPFTKALPEQPNVMCLEADDTPQGPELQQTLFLSWRLLASAAAAQRNARATRKVLHQVQHRALRAILRQRRRERWEHAWHILAAWRSRSCKASSSGGPRAKLKEVGDLQGLCETRMKPVPDGALSKFMTGIEGRPAPQVLQSGASCSRFDASSSSLSH
ncbi:unnamed protein product [Symbiodinium microadriaticum]|nr:unnamed protein product [Symbiodinium microadriaticum]